MFFVIFSKTVIFGHNLTLPMCSLWNSLSENVYFYVLFEFFKKMLQNKNAQTWHVVPLNDSYKAGKATTLDKQMEELQLAKETENYTTTWKIIHTVSGKDTKWNVKVENRDVQPPLSEQDLLEGSRTGHFVKVSLWYASLLTNTRFCFLYFRISTF